MSNTHSHLNRANQKGAVSLFIVIFTALLVTTITISFLQLMMKDQQQATYSDLSESAYDSAMAGVEDAKRLLLLDDECRSGTAAVSADRCDDIEAALTPATGESQTECDTLVQGEVVGETDGETVIQQHVGDGASKLDQAYTCVKVSLNTDDYLGSFSSTDSMVLIPLRAVGSFDSIVISWNLSKSGGTIDLPASGYDSLPKKGENGGEWPHDRPALLRAQLINGNGSTSFHLSDFNNGGNSNTLFLYPSDSGLPKHSFSLDTRRSSPNKPELVDCDAAVLSGDYACKVELTTPALIPANSTTAFLGLMAFYNSTDYKIELKNGSTTVAFARVQPEVDSTGRANDLFRRVVARVELGNTFNYPIAALETRHNICKNFRVTSEKSDYGPVPSTCDPTTDDE